jgi:tetratricopeptide (TPR) repeat protein
VTSKTLEPAIADGSALLQLLGPVQLRPLEPRQGQLPTLGRRTLSLVTYLAITGDTEHRRDHLATLFWESRGTEQALASLRQCLAELKSCFPDVLVPGRSTLRINPAMLKTDVAVLAAITSAATLAEAIRTLPQHVLVLPEISRTFDDWVKTERKRLHAQLADIVRARLAKGDASVDELAELKAAWHAVAPVDAPAIDDAPVERGMLRAPARAKISDRAPMAPNDAPLLIMAPVEFFGIAEGRELAEQLRDEVAGGLARIRDLRLVVERQPIASIPTDRHGDGYVLHSRLRNLSDGPQLTLQLLTWPAQEILWSTTTPFALATDFEAVSHVIGKIVGSILPELERNLLHSERPASGSLYVRYLKARHASRQPADFQAARAVADELEAIIAQDPGFVLPYLPLARLYNTDFVYTRAGSSGVTERDRAKWLSRRSTTIDPGHGHGWSQLAWSHLWQGEWSAAEECLEQALAINPFHADRLDEIAFAFMHLGKLEHAELLLERSKSLMVAPGHIYWNDRMLLDLLNGDPVAAIKSATNAGDDFLWSTVYSLAAHAHAGSDCLGAAQRFRTRVSRIFPNGVLPQFDDLAFWMRRSGMPFRHSAMQNIVLDGLRIGLGQSR